MCFFLDEPSPGSLFGGEGSQDTSSETDIRYVEALPPDDIMPEDAPKTYDIDKLAKAIAIAETNNCTKGVGLTYNNCHALMEWDSQGIRHPRKYDYPEESYEDFKEIWTKYYDAFPTYEMAQRYTGNDSPDTWLENVTYWYSSQ